MTRFLGLEFKTTKDAFIPRPETELLVKVCLDTIMKHCHCPAWRDEEAGGRRSNLIYILDIGTGTGNIAISLTKLNPTCKIVALDKSKAALIVAKENAKRFGVSCRIEFIKSDLFEALKPPSLRGAPRETGSRSAGKLRSNLGFDIIVSNPPYIPSWEIMTLAKDVKSQPRLAIDGGEDGLALYRRIIREAPKFIKGGGYLIIELGYDQGWKVKRLLIDAGDFKDIEIFKDFSNIDRVIRTRWISS